MGEIKQIPVTANEHMYPSISPLIALGPSPSLYSFPHVTTGNNGYSCVSQLDPQTVSMLDACGSPEEVVVNELGNRKYENRLFPHSLFCHASPFLSCPRARQNFIWKKNIIAWI